MCGRFVAATDADGLVQFFVVDERRGDDVAPSWNVAPTDRVRAVVEHEERRLLVAFRWGLVPHWAESARVGARMINARAETVAEKPAFREALARRRCLVPADGFYEWVSQPDGAKVPYFIHRPDHQPLAFAGLWEVWRDPTSPTAEPLRTCTIITTAAAPAVADLHDRMPVALPPDAWDAWLDSATTDPASVLPLLEGTPAGLTFHAVSAAVNKPEHNSPELLAPIDPSAT